MTSSTGLVVCLRERDGDLDLAVASRLGRLELSVDCLNGLSVVDFLREVFLRPVEVGVFGS